MQCPRCETDNALGTTYCAGCGAKLEMSDAQAQAQALASVRLESWQRAFAAMNRTLFFFGLAFIASLLFNAYATRAVLAEFSAGAPLPPAPPLGVTPAFIPQTHLPAPRLFAAGHVKPDKNSEREILAELASTARDRLNCTLFHRRRGILRGVLLSRTADEIRLITKDDWGPPVKPQTLRVSDVDIERSELPE